MSPEATPSVAKRPRPRMGEEVEVTIDSLAHGGAGVGRAEAGFVVFVRGAVPGDRVRARIEKAKRSFAEARLEELVERSPERVEPASPHPGAPWQVLPYASQLAEKERQVRDALERLGGFTDPPVEPIVPAVAPLRYRNKLEYSFGESEDGELALGFHRPGRWDVIDDIESDVLASERVDELRLAVRSWCREEGLSAYDRHDHSGFLRNLVVREGRRTGQLQARLVTSPGAFRHDEFTAAIPADSVLWTQAKGVAETTRGGKLKTLKGEAAIEEQLDLGGARLRFRISPDAFFQTNTEMAEQLYGVAVRAAGLTGRERVIDLYSGIGTIALAMALDSHEVVGVEVVERAVADAIENAKLNGVDNARFYAGDVRTAMRPLLEHSLWEHRQEGAGVDVAVIDPPRAGLSQKVVRRVLEADAQRIVYVSCNPTTLAPNARQMVDAGYELRSVRPVDMFPQTPHIECVALLSR
ncbi:MAG TPA: 23S rRNA (uracil(1939)-C(5))-methyltransferase RlmD [Thermoleophilaceae bacterium]|nr:23S rRNA (uracil(1939)-C(5))-methyltransferase RlmD [Thermoleophilaceae bacterium]